MPHTASRYLTEGRRVGLRHFTYDDAAEFTARARESKDLHHPWLFPPDTPAAYTAYAQRLIEDPAKAGFLVCERRRTAPSPASSTSTTSSRAVSSAAPSATAPSPTRPDAG